MSVVINMMALDSSGRDLHTSFLSHIIHHLTYMTGLSDHMVCQSLSLNISNLFNFVLAMIMIMMIIN